MAEWKPTMKAPWTTAKSSASRTSADVCPKCHGSGWELYTVSPQAVEDVYGIDNKGCQEFARKCTRCFGITKDTYDATNVPDAYRDCDIGKFDLTVYKTLPKSLAEINKSFVYDFKEWARKNMGLYLWSKTAGSGKTFLACCLGKSAMMRHGLTLKFITAVDYINKVSESYTLQQQGITNLPTQPYFDADLLILDDIGTQLDKPWQNQEMFRLINDRLQNGRPTIYTSNFPIDKLGVDERIKSRIMATTVNIPMPEESVRNKKAAQSQTDFLARVLNNERIPEKT